MVPVEGPLAHRLAEGAEDELVRCVGVVGVVEGEVGLPHSHRTSRDRRDRAVVRAYFAPINYFSSLLFWDLC